jgi:hypothetical protein
MQDAFDEPRVADSDGTGRGGEVLAFRQIRIAVSFEKDDAAVAAHAKVLRAKPFMNSAR